MKSVFSDPDWLDFDNRYVLYGGSGCNMARSFKKFGCQGAYEILYVRGGKAAGEYKCYVFSNEGDAQKCAADLANYYNDDNASSGRWGDVVYIYSKGSYVQETYIEFYAKQGTIASATPEAYLGMQFFFGGMSQYHPSAGGGNEEPAPPAEENPPGEETSGIPDGGGTSGEDTFHIPMSDSYTFTDPEGLDFDTRYVLYGDEKSIGVSIVRAQGCEVKGVYEILYVKEKKAVLEYKCYVASSAGAAQKMAATYQGTVNSDVVCLVNDEKMIQEMLEMLVMYAGVEEATPEAYLQYLIRQEGYQVYEPQAEPKPEEPKPEEPKPDEEEKPDLENPGTEDETTLKGSDPASSFDIKMSESMTFEDPQGCVFDKRYVLYGGADCGYAAAAGAGGFYEILYCREGNASAEYRCYVMADEQAAEAKAREMAGQGLQAQNSGNVVIDYYDGQYVQGNIELYVSCGVLEQAVPTAYLEKMFVVYGMTECEKGTAEEEPKPEETEPGPVLTATPAGENSILVTGGSYYNDPVDLDFDSRYVFYGDENCAMAGYVYASEVYEIFYARDGIVVAEYQCLVIDGAASCSETPKESMQVALSYLPQQGYEATPEGYGQFVKTMFGLTEYGNAEQNPE